MPKSLLRYVITKVELLSNLVQESCACIDATSLVLVLSAVPVIAREKSEFLRLTSCSFSSLVGTAVLESPLQGGASACSSLFLISGATKKAQHLSEWQLKCSVPQGTFLSAVEISWVTRFSYFSMETPFSGSPLHLPHTKSHLWH